MSESWYDPNDAKKVVYPKGEYDAVIEACTVHTAKNSQEKMRKLQVRVYPADADTPEIVLYDYLGKKSVWKIQQLARCVGQEDAFEAGAFNPVGMSDVNLKVKLGVGPDEYNGGEQNKISGYFLPSPTVPDGTAQPARSIPVANTRSGAGGYAPPKGVPAPADIDVPF